MLIAIVEIPTGKKATKDEAIARAKKSAPLYAGMRPKGLLRKDYLSGDEGGGGVYTWESREAAEAWYTPEWYDWIEERLGARPTLKMFDHYLTVDNVADEVRVEGVPITLEQEAAE